MSIIGSALKVVNVLGGVGTGVTLGEAVLKRAGILGGETSILIEGANVALDLLGAPKDSAIRPGRQGAPAISGAPSSGKAEPPALPPTADDGGHVRLICTECQLDSDMPLISGVAGEQIALGQCKRHYEQQVMLQGAIGAMYEGWALSYGLGESACGKQPKLSDTRYKKFKKVPGSGKQYSVPDVTTYYRDLNEWKDCVAAEKKNADAAQKQVDTAKASQKQAALKSGFALAAQQKQYEQEIAALKAQQQTTADAQKAAEMQAKIDAATAAKDAAEKLAAEIKQGAKDAEMQAKLDALTATISQQSSKPGGMDEFMQQLMMQMMVNNQQQQQAAPQYDPTSLLMPAAMPGMAQPMIDPMAMMQQEDPFSAGYDMWISGHEDEPLTDEMADLLGVRGASTLGEAQAMWELLQSGNFAPEDLGVETAPEVSGCSLGSCGVLRAS